MANNAVINDVLNTGEQSILESVKHMLNIAPNITVYDQDIIIHINTVFSILYQMGVGPKNGFRITSPNETWEYYFADDSIDNQNYYNDLKDFVMLRVKMLFDPPTTSAMIDSINNLIKELEYRLYTQSGGY